MAQCRLCYLEVNPNYCANIFNENDDPPSCKLIEKLANIKILESDPYTKLICLDCSIRLRESYEFLEMILETDNKLRHTSFYVQQLEIKENYDCMSEIGDEKIMFNVDNKYCPPVQTEDDDDGDYILVEEDIEIVEHKLKFDNGTDYIDDLMDTDGKKDKSTDQEYQNGIHITDDITDTVNNINDNNNNINNNNNNYIDKTESKINEEDQADDGYMIKDNANQIIESKYDKSITDDLSNSKKYQCDFCNRGFMHKYHFNSHVLSHQNDVKPFRCSACKRKFRRKCHLFNHRRSCIDNYTSIS